MLTLSDNKLYAYGVLIDTDPAWRRWRPVDGILWQSGHFRTFKYLIDQYKDRYWPRDNLT